MRVGVDHRQARDRARHAETAPAWQSIRPAADLRGRRAPQCRAASAQALREQRRCARTPSSVKTTAGTAFQRSAGPSAARPTVASRSLGPQHASRTSCGRDGASAVARGVSIPARRILRPSDRINAKSSETSATVAKLSGSSGQARFDAVRGLASCRCGPRRRRRTHAQRRKSSRNVLRDRPRKAVGPE